ncbi:VOC family protein [Pseudonocardia sp.]|uniref:VOC family protein n=1 Tax=Pseudonocardia sp. TaxID=60912 RepID=UPI0031FCB44F
MSIKLNHTIIWTHDKASSAQFLADILDLPVGPLSGPFLPIQLSNGVTLDYADTTDPVAAQHYAFLITEDTFDTAFTRIQQNGTAYWADPLHEEPQQIHHSNGGRGVYFADPNGHNMELLTRP